MPDTAKNVFISHVHEDDAGLGKIKDLLGKAGVKIRDSSINSDKPNNARSPDYIKRDILAPAIDWAGVFICYVTPKTKNSEWVTWEIEYAKEQGKRIVGIWGHGDQGCEIPEALAEYHDALVGWNSDKIIDAINGDFNETRTPDGSPATRRDIKRFSC
jgi:hypothetical protein